MPHYRVHIPSVDPGHEWIRQFVADLDRKGAATGGILYFARMADAPRVSFHEAERAYKDALGRSPIECTCHLLLQPRDHKHYLLSVAQVQSAMENDQKSVIVYDTRGIPADHRQDGFPRLMDVLTLIRYYERQFGKKRVLCRRRALRHLEELLQSDDRATALPRAAGAPGGCVKRSWWPVFRSAAQAAG